MKRYRTIRFKNREHRLGITHLIRCLHLSQNTIVPTDLRLGGIMS
ncbi:MAG: hypothetical protein NVS4B2_13700 [Chloroflexota bacterium]